MPSDAKPKLHIEPGGVARRRLILVRHGQSTANAANIFTGRSAAELTVLGIEQARQAARALIGLGVTITAAFTSAQERSIASARITLDALGSAVEPVVAEALNERDYGALTGLNKAEAVARFGEEQIRTWRRSWFEAPPVGESLRDTAARVLACYVQSILPAVLGGGDVLVIAHGNSLRGLVATLDRLTPADAELLEIGTGAVLVYELDPDSRVRAKTLLIDCVGVL